MIVRNYYSCWDCGTGWCIEMDASKDQATACHQCGAVTLPDKTKELEFAAPENVSETNSPN